MTPNKNRFYVSLSILILCYSGIQCLNKEVYEDSVDDGLDIPPDVARDAKSDFQMKISVVNNTVNDTEANNPHNQSLPDRIGRTSTSGPVHYLDIKLGDTKPQLSRKKMKSRLNQTQISPALIQSPKQMVATTDSVFNITLSSSPTTTTTTDISIQTTTTDTSSSTLNTETSAPSTTSQTWLAWLHRNSQASTSSVTIEASNSPAIPTSQANNEYTMNWTIPAITTTIANLEVTQEEVSPTISDSISDETENETPITRQPPTPSFNLTTIWREGIELRSKDIKLGIGANATPEWTQITSPTTMTLEPVMNSSETTQPNTTPNERLVNKVINETELEIQTRKPVNHAIDQTFDDMEANDSQSKNFTEDHQVMTNVDTNEHHREDQQLKLLVDSDDDDITLPPGVDIGLGSDIFRAKPIAKPLQFKPMLPMLPMHMNPPFTPFQAFQSLPPQKYLPPIHQISPRVPEYPGYQTIWVPIQLERDPQALSQLWKHMKEPNFIERGHIKNEPTLTDGRSSSWWRRPQPDFCFESVVVQRNCVDRRPQKTWSYNAADEHCYRYVDYCSTDKRNSFNTLHDCLISCWRAHV